MKRRLILIGIVALLALAADQVTKQMARSQLKGQPPVDVIAGYLALEYHENRGMAFGIGRDWPGGRYILLGVGIAALYFVWRMVRQTERGRAAADVAFGLIVGGALGNFIDRLAIGRVVDFVVMHWQRKAQWPAYNVADAALVVGVGLLLLTLGRADKRQSSAAASSRKRRTS